MSKPRIRYNSNQKLYTCYLPQDKEAHWVYIIGWGDTPEEAYWDLMERKADVRKKYQPTPEPLINITYIDPKEMSNPYSTEYRYKRWWEFWK